MSETFRCEIHPRVADLNFGGHVDNVVFLRLFDEARARFVGHPTRDAVRGGAWFTDGLLGGMSTGTGILVAQHRIQYLRELWFETRPVLATLWVPHVGNSSFTVAGDLRQDADEPVAAQAECRIVLTDRASARPAPIPDDLRARLEAYRGEPIAFR